MEYSTGVRKLKYYNTKDESYADFKRIWKAYYGSLPTRKLAIKWTGNHNPTTWMNNFYACYETN
jgi:hypothetical protein